MIFVLFQYINRIVLTIYFNNFMTSYVGKVGGHSVEKKNVKQKCFIKQTNCVHTIGFSFNVEKGSFLELYICT